MRRKWLQPLRAGNGGRGAGLAAVEHNLAVLPAPKEMTPTLQVGNSSPTMSVKGNDVSRTNARLQDANACIFEQQTVVVGSCDHGVE
jgi:hypothetical protein